jgi:hypothetical protein
MYEGLGQFPTPQRKIKGKKKKYSLGWMWWCMPVFPLLGRQIRGSQ